MTNTTAEITNAAPASDLTPEQQEFAAKLEARKAARLATPKKSRKARPTMAELARARFDRELAANPTAILLNPDARTGRQYEAYIDGRLVGSGDSYLAAEQARDEYLYLGLQHAHADSPADAATLTAEEVAAVAEVLLADQPGEVLVVNGLAAAHGTLCAVDDCGSLAETTCPGCGARVCNWHLSVKGDHCYVCFFAPDVAPEPPTDADGLAEAHLSPAALVRATHAAFIAAALAQYQHPSPANEAASMGAYLAHLRAEAAADPVRMAHDYEDFVRRGNVGRVFNPATGELEVFGPPAPPALTPAETADVDALAAYVCAPLADGDEGYCWPCGVWGACQHSPTRDQQCGGCGQIGDCVCPFVSPETAKWLRLQARADALDAGSEVGRAWDVITGAATARGNAAPPPAGDDEATEECPEECDDGWLYRRGWTDDHAEQYPCPACHPEPSVDEDLPFTPGQHEADEARAFLAALEARDYADELPGPLVAVTYADDPVAARTQDLAEGVVAALRTWLVEVYAQSAAMDDAQDRLAEAMKLYASAAYGNAMPGERLTVDDTRRLAA